MKNLYLFSLLVLLSVALVGTAEAAKLGNQVGAQQDQDRDQTCEQAEECDGAEEGYQKRYVDTGLAGDGIQNSTQDADATTTEPSQDQDRTQNRDRIHQDEQPGYQSGDQVQDRDRIHQDEPIQDRDRIHQEDQPGDQVQAREREHQDEQSGDQPQEQKQEREQAQLHTEEQTPEEAPTRMERFTERVRNVFHRLFSWF